MACHLHIDAEGKVTDWRFTRAIVRIAEIIAYEDAQARIDERQGDRAPSTHLWACWKPLGRRARQTAIRSNLDLPERRVVLDEQGKIAEIAVRERLDAHRVVEDFMIAANVAAAKALESKAAPVVYRVHEPPTPREAGRAEGLFRDASARTWRWARSSRRACSTACSRMSPTTAKRRW